MKNKNLENNIISKQENHTKDISLVTEEIDDAAICNIAS
jgi:hypothetical protein